VGKSRSNAEYVSDLYETFLQRTPSLEEVNDWLAQFDQGLQWGVLLTYFACCEESKDYMEGIFGTTPTRPEDNLVNDFYRGLLHRLPDSVGFGNWRDQMRKAQRTGARAFRDVACAAAMPFSSAGSTKRQAKVTGSSWRIGSTRSCGGGRTRRASTTGWTSWKRGRSPALNSSGPLWTRPSSREGWTR